MRQKLGQHFLKNKNILKEEVAALDLKDGETVIEIGSGRGALTHATCNMKHETRILAIERDPKLVEFLKDEFRENKNVEIVEGDVLKVLPSMIQDSRFRIQDYKIIGNIPYYLTGYLLRTIGELKYKPEVCVFIIQKEVAERMAAKPPKMNKLAASVQFWAKPEILRLVSRKDFSPPPEVESALVRLETWNMKHGAEERGKIGKIEEKNYYKAVNVLFQQPRKTILNNLAEGQDDKISKEELSERLKTIGIDPKSRPQDLSVEDIVNIAKLF